MFGDELDIESISGELAIVLESLELGSGVLREPELVAHNDFLLARELVLGSSQGLHGMLHGVLLASHREQRLPNVHSGHLTNRLAVGTSHTRLQSICSGAGQHLVDSETVPRVDSDSQVEGVLSCEFNQIFVARNTACFKRFRADLFLLHGDSVHGEREHVNVGLLITDIINTDLGIRHTSVVAGLGERFAVPKSVASGWSSTH